MALRGNLRHMIDIKELNDQLGGRIKAGVPLKEYSTFHIGGPAAFLFEANSGEDVVSAVTYCRMHAIPHVVIGGGSNILFSDAGFNGLVVVTKHKVVSFGVDGMVSAEAGVSWSAFLDAVAKRGLSGLEWGADIPGTLGGAIRGNAGAYGGEIKDTIRRVSILRGTSVMTLNANECGFGYRDSAFKNTNDIILAATFELRDGNPADIRNRMDEITKTRRAKLPQEPSAGSDFKNIIITEKNRVSFEKLHVPPEFFERGKVPTGWLVQEAGLLGTTIGGAKISERHGNIIVNAADATASDVLQLMSIIKTKVRNQFGIQLQEEIQLIGF